MVSRDFGPWIMFLLLLPASVAPAEQPLSSSDPLCFAFLREGDVYSSCGGKNEQISHFGDVEDFAVAQDQLTLVLIRYRAAAQGRAIAFYKGGPPDYVSHSALQTISLKGNRNSQFTPLETPTQLVTSCGTVLSLTWDPAIGNRIGLARDAIAGERVVFDPYRNFRCSSDRKTVAGWSNWDRKVLKVGLPPSQTLYDTASDYRLRYDVSQSGGYIAYNVLKNGHAKLCVGEGDGKTQCIEEGFDEGRISVADSDRVIFETTTAQGCHYKDPFHFSIDPRPGYTEGDLCPVIAYWHPGEKESQIVEPLARSPQWLSLQAAKALRDWSKHSGASGSAHP